MPIQNRDGALFMATGIDNSGLYRGFADAENRIDQFRAYAEKAGLAIGGYFGVQGLSGFVKEIVNVRSEFQNTEAMFKVFLGNADKASAFMKDIQKYAFNNVFEFKDLTQQAAQLLAFGTEANNVIGVLDKLSNVAAGVNQPLERFVELYNKAKSRNKLDATDIQQWSAMGDIISYLAEMLGKTNSEINSMVTSGNIGFKEIDQLLNNLTESGGKFNGMMEEKMKTLGDSVGLLQDSISAMFNELGEKSQDYLRGGILLANELVENYEIIGKTILELVAVYGTYKAAVTALTIVENLRYQATLAQMAGMTRMQAITDILRIKTEALNVAIAKNPYVAVGVAVAVLSYGLYKLYTHQTEAEKAQSRLNDSMKEGEKASLSETRELAKLKGELSSTTKGTKEYNDIRDQIVSKFGQYYQNLKTEIDTVGLLDSTYQNLTKAIQASFSARQYTKFAQAESENLDAVLSENLGKIQDRLLSDLGDEAGTKYYTAIRNALLQGKELSKDVIETIDKVQDKGTLIADSRLDQYINNIREAQMIADDIDKKARVKFGIEGEPQQTDATTIETKK